MRLHDKDWVFVPLGGNAFGGWKFKPARPIPAEARLS